MGHMTAKIRKYAETARISFTSKIMYLADFTSRSLFLVVILFVFMQIWDKALPQHGQISGFNARELVWYLAFTEIIMYSLPKTEGTVSDDIKSGSIGYILGKPLDYVWYQYASFLGELYLRVIVSGVIAAATSYMLVGGIEVTPIALGAWTVTTFLGASLSFFIVTSIALVSFWVEDSVPFFWIYTKLLFTLGGLFAPVTIYPAILRRISELSPFNYIFAAPAQLIVEFRLNELAVCIGRQLFWLVIFIALSRIIFTKGVKMVNVNGG